MAPLVVLGPSTADLSVSAVPPLVVDAAALPAGGTVLLFALAGVLLGTVSGLVPGLHANAFALLLAAGATDLPGPPLAVAGAVLAAGVVHTFLDVVPALALGVPDGAMAPGALPGHRLVLAGRGREALRLSALGSGLALTLAVPLALPVTEVVRAARPTLAANLPLVLLGVVCVLVATEGSLTRALGGLLSFGLAAGLGFAVLDLRPDALVPVGGVLAPLFGGLFGAPVLFDAMGGGGVPPQDACDGVRLRRVGPGAAAGTVGGALVGYLPGVSAAVASVLALVAVPGRSTPGRFVVATSGANTATAVFALFSLVVLGAPRTGVTVALADLGPHRLAPLLAVCVLAGALGTALVPVVGDRYLVLAGRVDATALSLAVLALLVCLSWLFAGVAGVALFALAALVGLVPTRVGCRRVHLMGVLIGPIVVGGG